MNNQNNGIGQNGHMGGQAPQRPAPSQNGVQRPMQAQPMQRPVQQIDPAHRAPQRPAAPQMNSPQPRQGQPPVQRPVPTQRPIQGGAQQPPQRPIPSRTAQSAQENKPEAPKIRRAAVNQSEKSKSSPQKAPTGTRVIDKEEFERQQALLLKQARQKSAEQ
ncbi:MAG: hypothetical protein J6Q64_05020, partial [Clostridia bacterium]|nr:hypothetical protein [Clostridia bacterium]